MARRGGGVGRSQAPDPPPRDLNQGPSQAGLTIHWSSDRTSGQGGRGKGGRGSPGDLAERRGQAGQVEGTGAAITTEQLPAIPAGRTLVLILLTRDTCVWKTQDGAALPETPTPTVVPQGHPSPLAHSQLKSCPDCLLPGAPHNPTISETLAPNTLSWEERTVFKKVWLPMGACAPGP